jgi:hypothetical protein
MVSLGFLSAKMKVAGYKIPILYPLLGLGLVAFIVIQKGSPQGAPPGGPPVAPGMPAPDVQFNLNPPSLMPGVPTTLQGQFQTLQGMPVTVPQGYYYVFLVQPTGMKQLVSQGSLGMNIAQFNIPINTQGLQPAGMAKYSITVTDVPLTQQELTM